MLNRRNEEQPGKGFQPFDESDFSITLNNELSNREQLEKELRERSRLLREERLNRQRDRYNHLRGPSHHRNHLDEENDTQSVHRTRPDGRGPSSISHVHVIGDARRDRPSEEGPSVDITLDKLRVTLTTLVCRILPCSIGSSLCLLSVDFPLCKRTLFYLLLSAQ